MNSQRFAAIKAVFLEARGVPLAGRSDLLAQRCGDDSELLEAVAELLTLDAEPDVALDQPALGPDFVVPTPDTFELAPAVDRRGWSLGNYRLLDLVADGGMGSVYRAEQTQPRRQVALKLLRAADAAPSVVARFRAEAEFLGRLQHPAIAQVFEAGTAECAGAPLPYIAMEWIEGLAITEYAEQARLNTRVRVALLIAVCEAVQHAHDRGVLHRDLKPSNILIDRDGQPKVIDFGIAAALDTAGAVGFTAGTPAYLAPELLELGDIAAAPRTDVYALGMVARQLLSTVTGGVHRGDLRAVIDKSREPRFGQRYQTVRELIDDLRRCLSGEPVAATRHSLAALGTRWLLRHHRVLTLGVTGLILAAVAAIALGWGGRQRDDANRVEAYLLAVLGSAAPSELGTDATLGALLDRVGNEVDQVFATQPEFAVAVHTKLAWLDHRHGALDRSAARAEAALALGRSTLGDHHPATLEARNVLAMISLERGDLPAAEAQLREVMAWAPTATVQSRAALDLSRLLELWGRFGEARDLLRGLALNADIGVGEAGDDAAQSLQSLTRDDAYGRLLALTATGKDDTALRRHIHDGYRRLLGSDAPQTLDAAGRLAIHLCSDAATRAEGLQLLIDSHVRCSAVYGPNHPDTLQALHDLGYGRATIGDLSGAVATCKQVWRLRCEVLGPDHLQSLCSLNNLARFGAAAGQRATAAEHFAELSQRSRRSLSTYHWYRGIFAVNRGRFLLLGADLEGAEAELADGVAILVRCLDDDAPPRLQRNLFGARINLALTRQRRGDLRTALTTLEEVHAEQVRLLGVDHQDTARSAQHLAELLHASGTTVRAEQMQREELARRRDRLGPAHDSTLETVDSLAHMLRVRGAAREAGDLLSTAVSVAESAGAGRQPLLLIQLALCQQELGDLDQAESTLADAGTLLMGAPNDHPHRAHLVAAQADLRLAAEDWTGAEAAYRDALARWLAILGPTNDAIGRMRNNLAGALDRQGKYREAGVEWQAALDVRQKVLGEDHVLTLVTASNAGRNLIAIGAPDRALAQFEDLMARAERTLDARSRYLAMFRSNYASCLAMLGHDTDALAQLERSVLALALPQGDLARVPAPILAQCRTLHLKLDRDPIAALEQLQKQALEFARESGARQNR